MSEVIEEFADDVNDRENQIKKIKKERIRQHKKQEKSK